MTGLNIRKNNNGFTVIEFSHWSVSPDRDEKWAIESRKGCTESWWKRNMELSWETGEGDPVYPRFTKEEHTEYLKYDRRFPVYVGWDFGRRRPAAVWLQYNTEDKQIKVLSELIGKDIIFDIFMSEVLNICTRYKGSELIHCVDPYGGVQKGDKGKFSNIELMSYRGLNPQYVRTNIEARVQKLEKLLEPKFNNGKPGIMIDKNCKMLVACMNGGLVLEDKDRPLKDKKYEDIHDALCYAIDHIKYLSCWDDEFDRRKVKETYSQYGRPLF